MEENMRTFQFPVNIRAEAFHFKYSAKTTVTVAKEKSPVLTKKKTASLLVHIKQHTTQEYMRRACISL
jgi:hypothetical protein